MDPFREPLAGVSTAGGAQSDGLNFMSNMYEMPPTALAFPSNIEDIGFGTSASYPQSSFDNMAEGPSQDSSKHQNNTVNMPLEAKAPRDGAVFRYHNVPIFVVRPESDAYEHDSLGTHQIFSLWHLNAMMRKYFLSKTEATKFVSSGSRKRFGDNYIDDPWVPKNLNDFKARVKFAGYKISDTNSDPDTHPKRMRGSKTVIGVKLAGEMNNVPNIWGDDLFKSQAVGFAVRWETIHSSMVKSWDGALLETKNTQGSFKALQIVPIIAKQGRVPYGATAKIRDPSTGQLLTANINIHDGNTYETKRYGWIERGQEKQYEEEVEVGAHFIPLGITIRRMGYPSKRDVEEARCTFNGYQNLDKNYEQVDIELLPDGKRETWLCA